jgi:hypothetical protein
MFAVYYACVVIIKLDYHEYMYLPDVKVSSCRNGPPMELHDRAIVEKRGSFG